MKRVGTRNVFFLFTLFSSDGPQTVMRLFPFSYALTLSQLCCPKVWTKTLKVHFRLSSVTLKGLCFGAFVVPVDGLDV